MTAWPASDIVVSSGTITFLDPCDNLDTFEATTQNDVDDDDYSGDTLYFTLTPFNVEKAVCADTVTYACSVEFENTLIDVSFLCDGFDGTAASQNLALTALYSQLESGALPAGVYTFTITATSQNGDELTSTFTWTLIDPCVGTLETFTATD